MKQKKMRLVLTLVCITFILLTSYSYLQKQTASFILITSLYNETNEERAKEYIFCFEKNITHTMIKKIHVIYDTTNDTGEPSLILNYLESKGIEITPYKGRPTFQYCFNLANTKYPNSAIVLTNADIYFNETLTKLNNLDLTGKFIALTRWNVLQDGSLRPYYRNQMHENAWSQDTWIFTTPFTSITNAHIGVGTQHCDGRIAHLAFKTKLHVLNPCKSIQCCHLHLQTVRHYERKEPELKAMSPIRWSSMEDYKEA